MRDRRHDVFTVFVVVVILAATFGLFVLKPWRAGIEVVVEDSVDASAVVTAAGDWEGHNGYSVQGVVELTGSTVRLLHFSAEPTPDPRVVLYSESGAVDLGALRGTEGQLVYELPAGALPSAYDAVALEDRAIGAAIARASLVPAEPVDAAEPG